ncbi:hypothetical protein [Embleya sp. NPDC059237]|uniref:hypothetical protein n=1 Tax=Embleya sp. NPDC059237 TaxID=3346784 RepID=UPI00369645ED
MPPHDTDAVNLASEILIGTTRQNVGNLAVALVGLASTVVIIVWAAREYRTKHRPQLWILLAASLLGWLADSGARMLIGLQADPGANGLILYRAFGIDMAIWMGFMFPPYICFIGYSTFLAFEEGWTRRAFRLILPVAVTIDTAGEYVMIHGAHLYSYTGRQPLDLFGLPLVWPCAIVTTPMLTGATVALLSRHVHGRTWLLTLPLLGSGYIAYLAAVSWPSMVARSTDASSTALTIIGIATLGGLLATVHLLGLFLPEGPPRPRTKRPPEPDRLPAASDTDRSPAPACAPHPPHTGAGSRRTHDPRPSPL